MVVALNRSEAESTLSAIGGATKDAAVSPAPASSPAAIEYARVDPVGRRRPSAVVALALCLPGAVCWLQLILVLVRDFVRTSFVARFAWILFRVVDLRLALLCWVVAIVTALASLALYRRRRPKP
jgi:hypothetical protein